MPAVGNDRFNSFRRIESGGTEHSTGMAGRSLKCLTMAILVRSSKSEKFCRSSKCGDITQFPIFLIPWGPDSDAMKYHDLLYFMENQEGY